MIEVAIDGVELAEIQLHGDERGSFAEIHRESNRPGRAAQANHAHSKSGVLRGLHYHVNQADLWYLVRGEIQVALVELRGSRENPPVATFVLTDQRPTTLYIPPGVAHGYLALTDSDLVYLVNKEYDASDEHGIAWNDPLLAIDWHIVDPVLSERDRHNAPLQWDLIPEFS